MLETVNGFKRGHDCDGNKNFDPKNQVLWPFFRLKHN